MSSNWSLSHISPQGGGAARSTRSTRGDASSTTGAVSAFGGASSSSFRTAGRSTAFRTTASSRRREASAERSVAHVGSTHPLLMQKAYEEQKIRDACQLGDAAMTTDNLVGFVAELVDTATQLIVQGDFAAAEIAANRAELLSRCGSAKFSTSFSEQVDPAAAAAVFKGLRRKYSDEDWIVLCRYRPTSHSAITDLCQQLTAVRARALSTTAFAAKSQKRFSDARAALMECIEVQGEKSHLLLNLLSITSTIFFQDDEDTSAYEESLALAGQLIETVGAELDDFTSPSNVDLLVNGPVEKRQQMVEDRRYTAQMLVTAMITRSSVVAARLYAEADSQRNLDNGMSPRSEKRRITEAIKTSIDEGYTTTRLTLDFYETHRLASQELGAESSEFQQCCDAIEDWVQFVSVRLPSSHAAAAVDVESGEDDESPQPTRRTKKQQQRSHVAPALSLDDLWRHEVRRAREIASESTVLCDGVTHPALQSLYQRSPYHLAAPLLLGAAYLNKKDNASPQRAFLAAAVEHLTSHSVQGDQSSDPHHFAPTTGYVENTNAQASRSLSYESAHPAVPSVAPTPQQQHRKPRTAAYESPSRVDSKSAFAFSQHQMSDSPPRSVEFTSSGHPHSYQAGTVIAPPPLASTTEANPPPTFAGTQHQRIVTSVHNPVQNLDSATDGHSQFASPGQQSSSPGRAKSSGIVASPRPVQRTPN